MRVPNVIFLTGSPEADNLSWNEQLLSSSFVPAVQRFLGEIHVVGRGSSNATPTSQLLPKWRQIPVRLSKQQSHGQPDHDVEATQFWSFEHDATDNDDFEHTEFLEHSLAVLQGLEASQINVHESATAEDTTIVTFGDATLSTNISLHTSDDSFATNSFPSPSQQIVNYPGPITNLAQIPNARYLHSIAPQTITINVVASIITVQPTRTVRVRKSNTEMTIVEVLLGDETRAGFSVTFWLPPLPTATTTTFPSKDVQFILSTLRNGDLVLLTNIALSSFQNNVYGQSLSRRISRNNTEVARLSNDSVVIGPLAAKVQNVKSWSARFIGGRKRYASRSCQNEAGAKRRRREEDDVPPDTQ